MAVYTNSCVAPLFIPDIHTHLRGICGHPQVDTGGHRRAKRPWQPPKVGAGWVRGWLHFVYPFRTEVRYTTQCAPHEGGLREVCGTHRPNVWPAFTAILDSLGYPVTYNTTCTMPHHGYTHTHPTPCRADSPALHIHAHAHTR